MSYCRFSCMNFKCDIYAYESVYNCWTIHVASNRIVGDPPRAGSLETLPKMCSRCSNKIKKIGDNKICKKCEKRFKKWAEDRKKHSEWLENCRRVKIDLPHAGETFNEPTLKEFKRRLMHLKSLGYRMPDHIFEMISEEMEE